MRGLILATQRAERNRICRAVRTFDRSHYGRDVFSVRIEMAHCRIGMERGIKDSIVVEVPLKLAKNYIRSVREWRSAIDRWQPLAAQVCWLQAVRSLFVGPQ